MGFMFVLLHEVDPMRRDIDRRSDQHSSRIRMSVSNLVVSGTTKVRGYIICGFQAEVEEKINEFQQLALIQLVGWSPKR